MTVPKNKRSISKVEFFHYAYKLNNCITQVLLKDFGIKRINKDEWEEDISKNLAFKKCRSFDKSSTIAKEVKVC